VSTGEKLKRRADRLPKLTFKEGTMENHDVQKLKDNDATKHPRSYPVEGDELPAPQSDVDDNDPVKPPGASYPLEGE
jgi:hypothetical protein